MKTKYNHKSDIKKIGILAGMLLMIVMFSSTVNAAQIDNLEITNPGRFYPGSILCYKTTVSGACVDCSIVMKIHSINGDVLARRSYNFFNSVRGCLSIPSNAENKKHVLKAVVVNKDGNVMKRKSVTFVVKKPNTNAPAITINNLEINNKKSEYLPGDSVCSRVTITGACENCKLAVVMRRRDGLDESLPKRELTFKNAAGEKTFNGLCMKIPYDAWGGDYFIKAAVYSQGNVVTKKTFFNVRLDDTLKIRRIRITDMGDRRAGTEIKYDVVITGICHDCKTYIQFKKPGYTRDEIWAAFSGYAELDKDTAHPAIFRGDTYTPFIDCGGTYRLIAKVKKDGKILVEDYRTLTLKPVSYGEMWNRYNDARFEWMLNQAFPSEEGWVKNRIV